MYSFCGENANFSILNGIIVLSSMEEIFYGGNLDGELSDVVGYSMTFYIPVGNDERILLCAVHVYDGSGDEILTYNDTG